MGEDICYKRLALDAYDCYLNIFSYYWEPLSQWEEKFMPEINRRGLKIKTCGLIAHDKILINAYLRGNTK